MPKIAIVDTDRDHLDRISSLLNYEGIETESFCGADKFIKNIDVSAPDLIIVETEQEEYCCGDIIRKIRSKTKALILVLTASTEESTAVTNLQLGADGILRKHRSDQELFEYTLALLRRSGYTLEQSRVKPIRSGELEMDPLRHHATWKGKPVDLTAAEFVVLYTMARQPGYVKSREQLVDVVYPKGTCVEFRTVDSHIKRLRRKMRAVDPGFSAIKTLYGIGYRYNEL